MFFLDSFKFFLSLYGHKLPVLAMDVSSDSSLLVSGSADKNIKIWGLDFGDCHRSLFAHDDSVMQVCPCQGTMAAFVSDCVLFSLGSQAWCMPAGCAVCNTCNARCLWRPLCSACTARQHWRLLR